MPKSDLLPCPFCGSDNITIIKSKSIDGLFAAGCIKCNVSTAYYVNEKFAAETWNTRASGWIPVWVSCEEAMPEHDGFYLAYYTFADGRHACDMVYFNVGSPISDSITHWMPLPSPPIPAEKPCGGDGNAEI